MRISKRIPDFAAVVLLAAVLAVGCTEAETTTGVGSERPTVVDRLAPDLDRVIDADVSIDTLAVGFTWAEGPVWVEELGGVLFSDTRQNRIHFWSEESGERVWLEPSGYTGTAPRDAENGSNGLLVDADGRLVLCQHGDRRMARLATPLADPAPEFETVVDRFEGRRFSSPNDAAFRSDGSLWFTDPPYGLPGGSDSPEREIPFNGVYALFPDGRLVVVTDTLTRPNGIAFSPDERTLYVANSDPRRAWWAAYDIAEDGSVVRGRLLLDATSEVGTAAGLPDGLKVDRTGTLFATGPGGVWIISPGGEALGRIRLEDPAANVAFGGTDGRTLFITASSRLLRTRVLTGR